MLIVRAATRGVAAALQRGLSRGILAESGLHHVAEDGFVNLLGIETGATRGFGDDLGAKLDGGKTDSPP